MLIKPNSPELLYAPLKPIRRTYIHRRAYIHMYEPKSVNVAISRIPCHFAQPFWAYELPHRREIVPGAVFFRKSPLPDFGNSTIVMTALRQ